MFVSHLAPRGAALAERDLASVELWETSLARSLRRRELAERQRRQAPKTKGTAAVMSAALLASPMLPVISAARAHDGPDTVETSIPDKQVLAVVPTLLREGDTGRMVAAVQRELAIDPDGIFGPITRRAVLGFQGRVGLARTGDVDAGTWKSLFRASVSYVAGDSAIAERIVRDEARPEPRLRVVADQERRVSPPSPEAAVEVVAPDEREPDVPPASPARPRSKRPSVETVPVTRPVPAKRPTSTPAPAAGCGTFASPVEGTVTGSFGEARGDHRHSGQDIAAPSGTPVRAVDCGTVTQAAGEGGYGNLVCVQHSAAISTCYAHLSSFETKRGDYVEVGQIIGRVGSTGNSTGPHLHFEVRENGTAVSPEPYLNGKARVSNGPAVQPSHAGAATRTRVPTHVSVAAVGTSAEPARVAQADVSADARSGRARLATQAAAETTSQAAAAVEPQAVTGAEAQTPPVVAHAVAAPVVETPPAPAPAPVVETPADPAPAPAPAEPVAETPPVTTPDPAPVVETPPVATPDPAPAAATPEVEAPSPAAEVVVAPSPEPAAPVAEAPIAEESTPDPPEAPAEVVTGTEAG